MTILYAYLIAGALLMLATYRIRLAELNRLKKSMPSRYALPFWFGVIMGIAIWPIVAIAMLVRPDDYDAEVDDA